MYADRYGTGPQIKPGSLGLALVLTALPIVGLIAGLQISHALDIEKKFLVYRVPPAQVPPPVIKPKAKPDPQKPFIETIYRPPVTPPLPPVNPIETTTKITFPPPLPPINPGQGDGGTVVTPIKPVAIVGAEIDGRYRNLLQPPYPAAEIRAGNSGRVVVRVLVGADGLVKQVAKVAATSDAFYAAAERQALTKWRFKPATRDGEPIDQWKQMSLRFELSSLE